MTPPVERPSDSDFEAIVANCDIGYAEEPLLAEARRARRAEEELLAKLRADTALLDKANTLLLSSQAEVSELREVLRDILDKEFDGDYVDRARALLARVEEPSK